jgi:hypothetical protein
MADGRPIRERRQTVFYPTDPKLEEPKFKSVNKWGRKQLDLLGVQFVPNAKKRLDLNKVLNINENEWPPAIQQRIQNPLNLTNWQEWQSAKSSWRLSTWND